MARGGNGVAERVAEAEPGALLVVVEGEDRPLAGEEVDHRCVGGGVEFVCPPDIIWIMRLHSCIHQLRPCIESSLVSS